MRMRETAVSRADHAFLVRRHSLNKVSAIVQKRYVVHALLVGCCTVIGTPVLFPEVTRRYLIGRKRLKAFGHARTAAQRVSCTAHQTTSARGAPWLPEFLCRSEIRMPHCKLLIIQILLFPVIVTCIARIPIVLNNLRKPSRFE